MAVERGDVLGLHHSLDRLEPALDGRRQAWDNAAFDALRATYGGLTKAQPRA